MPLDTSTTSLVLFRAVELSFVRMITSGNCQLFDVGSGWRCGRTSQRVWTVFDGRPRTTTLFSDRLRLSAIERGNDIGCCLSRCNPRPCSTDCLLHRSATLLSVRGVSIFKRWTKHGVSIVDGLFPVVPAAHDDSGFTGAARGRMGGLWERADRSTTTCRRRDDVTGSSMRSSQSLPVQSAADDWSRSRPRPRRTGSIVIASSRSSLRAAPGLAPPAAGLTSWSSGRRRRDSAGKMEHLRQRRALARRVRSADGDDGGAGGGAGCDVGCRSIDRASRISSFCGGFATAIWISTTDIVSVIKRNTHTG